MIYSDQTPPNPTHCETSFKFFNQKFLLYHNLHKMAASKVLKRPTPSTLEEWEQFPTVNDDKAQMRLARAMGYPPSWRVVRYV